MGDTNALVSVGFAYSGGSGVERNPHKASEWFERAIEHGDLHALVLVGRLYYRELNDIEKGIKRLERAAELRYKESYIELAFLYADKTLEQYAPKKAVDWNWKMLCDGVDIARPGILYRLAQYYWNGEGVEKNSTKIKSMNFRDSIRCLSCHLWDEDNKKLISFKQSSNRVA